MRRMALCLAVAVIFLATLVILFAQEQATAPVYKDGDYWWYRVAGRIYELTIVAGKLKIFDPKPDQKIEVEGEQAAALSGMVAVGETDRQLVQFPLAVGKEWHDRYDTGKQVKAPKGGQVPLMRSAENQVMGMEDVTTLAGTFRAYKIQRRENERGKNSVSGSVYYSPETRSVVKYEYGLPNKATKVVELTKYGSAPEK